MVKTVLYILVLALVWFAGIYLIWAFKNSNSEFEEIEIDKE